MLLERARHKGRRGANKVGRAGFEPATLGLDR
ncbi:MAG: hypothetical protein SLRJCFUN_000601, partial [Candidatus Fervidibacter sp.]